MCANTSLTIQDALGKDKSQYPHAPNRSISKLMLFLLLSSFLLIISSFYFFNKSIAMKEKGACKYLSPLSLAPSLSLSQSFTLERRWRGGGLSFLLLLIVSWYSESVWSTTVRLPSFLDWPHRTGPQCSRPPVSERCCEWSMRKLGSVRSGPGELCCCCCWVRGWRRIGQTANEHTQLSAQ